MGRTPTLPTRALAARVAAAARRSASGVACVVAILVLVESVLLQRAPWASADAIASKRKEAAHLADAIDTLNNQIEQLDEDQLQAQERLKALQTKLRSTSSDVAAAQGNLEVMRKRALEQALRAFANPPTDDVNGLTGATTLNEIERRSIYRNEAVARGTDAQDALRSAKEDLAVRQADLSHAKDAADALTRLLATKRQKANVLVTRYEALEKQAQGDLAQLIAQAEAARQAEEARQARLALQKKAEAARKALAKVQQEAAALAAEQRAAANGKASAALGAKARAAAQLARTLSVDAGTSTELPASPGGRTAVQVALSQLGKPYVWGAAGPSSFDCSGLVMYAWRAAGRSLPHSSRSQYAATTRVSVDQAKPGDLVFYGSPIHHVGMYIGNGQMVEASRRGKPVLTSSIFRRDLVGVGRVG